ncbi:peptidoglycan-binding protein [Streptomyces sp. NPDC088725]|uniref:peptidoglycan-binding domain-containing protein n=1 Tax=Streptomyces sp. NPDC088725 TaxID=3365873 RepID=UPI0037F8C769
MTGQLCPVCGTSQLAEGRPGCDCGERTAEHAAPPEDFEGPGTPPYAAPADEGQDPAGFAASEPLPPPSGVTAARGPGRRQARISARAQARERRKPLRKAGVVVGGAAVFGAFLAVGVNLSWDDGKDRAMPAEALDEPDPGAVSGTSPEPSAPPTPSASASPSPMKASTSPSPSPTKTREAAPPAPATRTVAQAPQAPQAPSGSSLGPGDSGPAVVALQQKLTSLHLYQGPVDGTYDQDVVNSVTIYQAYRQVQGDPAGVYGPNTKASLESEPAGQGPPGYGGGDHGGPRHGGRH